MKIVYDDIIYSLQKAGGISELWSNVTNSYTGDIVHYIYDNCDQNLSFKKTDGHEYIQSSLGLCSFKRYFDVRIKENAPFIFHSSYYRICKNANAINVTTVHDFMYEHYRKDFKSNLHKIQKKHAIENSQGIICISENTKKDMERFCPNICGKVKVIYNGYNDIEYRYKCLPKEKYFVYVGGRKRHKHFSLAADIAKYFPDYKLVIVGGGDLDQNEIDMLTGITYEKKGFTSTQELCDIYNSAFMLLYTSDYEGFGIPPIEAQACGCVVACQNNSSLSEVVGKTGITVDPKNMGATINMIKEAQSEKIYNKYRDMGLENVKRFSWKKCAQEYYEFYRELLETKRL